ncbi:MAG: porin [Proteobacteria bacterium]|nr:porin [Pseudomonadota bacterium]
MFKKTHLRSLLGSILIGAMAAISTPAMATNEAMLDLLKILKDKGSISAQEYELLANAAKADGEKVEGTINEMKADVDKKTKNMPKITTKGKFKVASQDGDWEFQPIGRIFWDYIANDNDGGAIGTYGDSGFELRRARLGMQGKYKPISWKAEMDFADQTGLSWKDVWVAYNGKMDHGKWWVKLGQAHTAFGHATISSSKYMPLVRRPLFADGPQHSRRVGISAYTEGKRWFAHTSYQLPGLNDDNVAGATEDRTTLAFRLGGTPFKKDKKHLLHIGGSFMHEELNGDRFNNIDNNLVSHLGDGDQLEWDNAEGTVVEVDQVDAFGAEAIGVWGPLHGVFEYVAWDVQTKSAGSYDLDAFAFDVGYFFTGESMKYKTKGQFSGITPKKSVTKGGWGAWQLAARYEQMDLRDGNRDGGEAEVFTVGLNWHPTSNTRVMADYATTLDIKCGGVAGASTTCDGATGTEPSAFTLRAMMYY